MLEIVGRCGANVRRLRVSRGLSQTELARRAGVSKGTLSQLEAAEGNPTIETLWSLAKALGVPFVDLLAEAGDEIAVIRGGDVPGVRFPGIRASAVDRIYGKEVTDIVEATYFGGEVRDAVPDGAGTVTRAWIASGCIELTIEGETLRLETGDFVRFRSDVPHRFAPQGGDTRVLMLVNYGGATGHVSAEDPLLAAIADADAVARGAVPPPPKA
ncbi:XRE family transcriptional regulator [Patulibacter sp. NPDC049589]|uniref:helix-turn-helix domain-containing protein n=1 Tax=Patulibacter sp. NPDC049589 TaxID=3154731 RepID=UPI0034343CD2